MAKAPRAAEAPADETTAPVALPAQIKMTRPHGFIDDAGVNRYWRKDQVVFDPADVALLHERKADFEVVPDAPAKQ